MKLEQAIHCFKEAMIQENVSPEKGLGTEGFRFASTLIPVVNVDLLVVNEKKEILLPAEMIHIDLKAEKLENKGDLEVKVE